MIVDCLTHTWEAPEQLGRAVEPSPHQPGSPSLRHDAGAARHLAAAEPVDKAIVLGFKSHYLNADLSNDQLAAYVRNCPDRMIGFAGIDPAKPKEAIEEIDRAHSELHLRGLTVAPAAQDFHPTNSQAMLVYARADELKMPVIFHTGIEITAATKLEYAKPVLLDEIARELPNLKIIIAHMGCPWIGETMVLLAKHPNVYAEISLLLDQPWQAYQALLSASTCGVIDKLMFGSGFPHMTASDCIEGLYSINHMVHGTNLPAIPREQLRRIVECDALGLMGIADTSPRVQTDQM